MFDFFKTQASTNPDNYNIQNFDYIPKDQYYFDGACQTLRPQEVILAEKEYYQNFNSCGHRVKYKWGEKTDKIVEECRAGLLDLLGLKEKDYTVAFTLNTTFGINQVLFQLPQEYKNIYISDIEHNSVFIPSIQFAKQRNGQREILNRELNGGIELPKTLNSNPVFLANTTSNIDGRSLRNLSQIITQVHSQKGLVLLDACQSFTHNLDLIKNQNFDACFGSGHKMYGPSVGFIIIKKELVKELDSFWLGGSTVSSVQESDFDLIDNDTEMYARLEPGLQNYAGIVGLNAAIKWLKNYKNTSKAKQNYTQDLEQSLQDEDFKKVWESYISLHPNPDQSDHLNCYLNFKLKQIPNTTLLNPDPSPIVSLYSSKMDGHKLAMVLSEFNVMCRSGYHCCHYYLIQKKNLPPLFRISLGLEHRLHHIDFLIERLKTVLN